MRLFDYRRRVVCGVLCALLSACGGGGGGGSDGGSDGDGGTNPGRTGRLPVIQGPLAQLVAVTSRKRLISFERGASVLSTSMPLQDMQSEPAALEVSQATGSVLLLDAGGFLHAVDPSTGVQRVLAKPSEPVQGTKIGMELTHTGEALRVTSNTGTNLLIKGFDAPDFQPDDLLTTRLDALPVGIGEIAGTQNLVPCGNASSMYFLSTVNDELLIERRQSGHAILARIGSLGVDVSEVSGFEIFQNADRSDVAIAVLVVGGEEAIYAIDLQTGRATREGLIPNLLTDERVVGLAALPQRNAAERRGNMIAVTESGKLISFDAAAPQTICVPPTTISGLQTGEQIVDIDRRPKDGKIYALTDGARLYTLSLAPFGAAELHATLTDDPAPQMRFDGKIDRSFDIDFDGRSDLLQANSTSRLLTIFPDSGMTQLTSTGRGVPIALSGSYGPSPDFSRPSISITSGDPRRVAAGARSDVAASSGISYVSAPTADGRSTALFSAPLELRNAVLFSLFVPSEIASRKLIGSGEPIRGFAYTPNETATVYAVTMDNRLLSFKATAPSQPDLNLPVTGLTAGENILSIDLRVSDDQLYAITDKNRLYTIDMSSGAVTFRVALTPAANDDNPFVGLTGGNVEIDFNPVTDQLRVTGVAGENFRVDADTGVTITDPPLSRPLELPAPPQFRGAVYVRQTFSIDLNSVRPPPTLFSIDVANDRVVEGFRSTNSTLVARDRATLKTLVNQQPSPIDVKDVLLARPVDPQANRIAASAIVTLAGGQAMFANIRAGISSAPDGLLSLESAVPLPSATDTVLGFAVASQQRFVLLNGQSLLILDASGTRSVTLTGLQSEALQSIAVRNDGSLYGLAASGTLYRIDPTTGSAAVAVRVTGATLRGSKLYLTFNPVDDQPSILTDTGQVAVVDFATGAATERLLAYVAPVASATAYSSNVVGSTQSLRFILDTATSSLRIAGDIRSAGSGSQVIDGSLSFVDVLDNGVVSALTPLAAFDVAAGDDSQTLVALQPLGATQSTLYRTDREFPKVVSLGTIGPAGTLPVRGLTSRIK